MDLPERLTLVWLRDHADQRLVGPGQRWDLITWNHVVYLKISQPWTPEQVGQYVRYLSGMRRLLRAPRDWIFLVFETAHMQFREEDAYLHLSTDWIEFLDQENLSVCLVDERPERRERWHRLYTAIGRRYRVQIFGSPDEALAWVRAELAVSCGPATAGGPATERIGEFLVKIEAMTSHQVRQVLQAQESGDNRRFGDIALDLGFVHSDAIKRYVNYLEKYVAGT